MKKYTFFKYVVLVVVITTGMTYAFRPSEFFKDIFYSIFSSKSVKQDSLFLDKKGSLSAPLEKLLRITEIPEPYTVNEIVQNTQARWLRSAGSERYQLKERNDLIEYEREIKSLCKELGFVNEVLPEFLSYKYGIILGATIGTMRKRFGYLNHLIKNGLHVDRIIVLVGQRPRFVDNETEELITQTPHELLPFKKEWKWEAARSLPKTETELAQLVYEQSDFCDAFLNTPITFIDAPMIVKENGTVSRPTTESTITTFLATNPEVGSCLFISNQPYVPYQDSVVKTLMPSTFSIETVGDKSSDSIKISDYLDTIARTLFYDQKRLQLSSAC